MIHVLATIQLHPGMRDEFLKHFRAIVPAVREEAGCLEYGPTIEIDSGIPAQANLGSDAVVVVEKWESLDALKAHLVAPHMKTYREKVKDMVAGTKLHILEPA